MLDKGDSQELTETKITPSEVKEEVIPMQKTGNSIEERLKDDLKISYMASGVLDITSGGYGFLRHDYSINPMKDIYVSTSHI